MGIQINGQTDIISATDGSLTVSGAELPTVTNLNATGVVTATSFSGGAYYFSSNPFNFIENSGATLIVNGDDNIIFRTDNTTERVRIDSSGNLGIGTNNPSDKLSIWSAPNALVLGAKDTTRGNHIFQLLADDLQGHGELRLYRNSASGTHEKTVEIASNGISYLIGGGTGIGTNNPETTLHTYSTSQASNRFQYHTPTTLSTSTICAEFKTSSNSLSVGARTGFQFVLQEASNSYIGAYIQSVRENPSHHQGLSFSTWNGSAATPSERIRVTKDGYVGIGTDNPGNKLEVHSGGVILKNQSNSEGLIFQSPRPTTLASVQLSGGRGIVESTIVVPNATTTNIAQTHWGGLVLVGYSGASYQGYQLVSFGYNGTPSVLHTVNWIGSLTTTYTTASYTLRVSHNAGANVDFWVILIGV